MDMKLTVWTSLCLLIAGAFARPSAYDAQPFAKHLKARQSYNASGLEVDLGYARYQGYSNTTSNLNIFKGSA